MSLDKEKIADATVRFLRRGGQGVIVPSGLIVTAAHVVNWDMDGGMTGPLADHYYEEVKVGRRTITAEVYAVEPVSDIAVLGAPDDQGPLVEAFEDCLEPIAPVAICTKDFPLKKPIPIFLRTHREGWVAGRAFQHGINARSLFIEADEGIEGGTSGGPVVTAQGLLLGVVSTAGGVHGEPAKQVSLARLHLTAPRWLVRRMLDPGRELRAMRRVVRDDHRRRARHKRTTA